MKHILTTSIIAITAAGPAMADTYTLNWYDGDTKITQNTCTVDGTITLPSTPTKPGYTFNGWVVAFNLGLLDTSLYPHTISYKYTDDDTPYCEGGYLHPDTHSIDENDWFGMDEGNADCTDSRFAGMSNSEYDGEWRGIFSYGTVKGVGLCSSTRGTYAQTGTPDTSSSGQYCWCRATGFASGNSSTFQSVSSSSWVFDGDLGSSSDCTVGCASNCVFDFIEGHGFRMAIYGMPPNGFTRLQYIQTDGNSWIDTGITGHMNYTYEIDFQQINTGQYRNWGVLGQSGYQGLNMSLTFVSIGINSIVFGVRWESTNNNENYVSLPNIDTNRHVVKIDDGNVYWDGSYVGITAGHNSNTVINYNIFLGTANPADTTPTLNAVSKYYSYKVWDNNGNLIQNFIPARRNSDSAVGMYDSVSGQFFTNSGTGSFTAGPVWQ